MYYSIKVSSSKFQENLGTRLFKKKPCSVFLCRDLRLCKQLFCISENLGTRNAYGGCRSPPYAAEHLQVSSILFFCGCGLRNKMPVLSHSPAALLSRKRRMPQPRNRCGGFCGRAVRSALAAALRFTAAQFRRRLCRFAPLRPLQQPQAACGTA